MSGAVVRGQFTRFSGVGGGEHFPDPFLDVASLSVPANMRSALYWCIVPGTPIEMADFSIKNIEDVRGNDRVMTQSGTCERVKAGSARDVDEENRP